MQFIVILYQLQITLYALLLGLFFGVLYDSLRIVRMLAGITPVHIQSVSWTRRLPCRHIGKLGRGVISELLFVHLLDILYGLSTGASFCVFLYALNNGRFRWYLLCAWVYGILLECGQTGDVPFRVYCCGAAQCDWIDSVFADTAVCMDWKKKLSAVCSGRRPLPAPEKNTPNGKSKEELDESGPVYIDRRHVIVGGC